MKPIGKKQPEAKVNNESEYAAPTAEAEKVIETEKIDFSNVEIEPLFKDFVDFETFSKSDFRAVKVLACEAVPKSKKLLKFTLDDGTGENRTILSGIHAYYEPEQLVGKTCVAITNLPPRPMMGLESCGMLLSAIHKENGEERLNLLMLDPTSPPARSCTNHHQIGAVKKVCHSEPLGEESLNESLKNPNVSLFVLRSFIASLFRMTRETFLTAPFMRLLDFMQFRYSAFVRRQYTKSCNAILQIYTSVYLSL